MKPLLVILFLAAGVACIGQNIADTNNTWNTLITKEVPYGARMTEIIRFTEDTLINSVSYKKVIRSLDETQASWNPYGFIRQDQSRVYYKMTAGESEKLMYDFNLNLFDTVTVYGLFSFMDSAYFEPMTYHLTSIDSIQIGDSFRRQLHMSIPEGCSFVEAEQWVDGVGGLSGILHNFNLKVGDDGTLLLCFKVRDTLLYQDPENVSCYIVTATDRRWNSEKSVTLFPNPATDKVNIILKNCDETVPVEINIINEVGKRILYEAKINNNRGFQLNLAGIPDGIYFYELRQNSAIIGRGKLIRY